MSHSSNKGVWTHPFDSLVCRVINNNESKFTYITPAEDKIIFIMMSQYVKGEELHVLL